MEQKIFSDVTYYDDFDHNDALVCSDNPFYDEFYVQFTTFYKTLENTSDYYVLYCATDAGVNPTMYVVVEMTDGNLVFYAISQDGIQQVDKIPTFEFDERSPKSRMIRHTRLLPYRNQQAAHQKQVTRRLLQRLQIGLTYDGCRCCRVPGSKRSSKTHRVFVPFWNLYQIKKPPQDGRFPAAVLCFIALI